MSASSTVKSHKNRAGTSAASTAATDQSAAARATSPPRPCPIHARSAKNYRRGRSYFYDWFVDASELKTERARDPPHMMRSFEISVAPEPISPCTIDASLPRRVGGRQASAPLPQKPAREVLDIFIGGANVTARVADRHASSVLRDLGLALAGLAEKTRGKIIVRFYDDPWELCVERVGKVGLLSVYRAGGEPRVAVYDAPVAFDEIVESAKKAISLALDRRSAPPAVAMELRAALDALDVANIVDTKEDGPVPPPVLVMLDPDKDVPIAFGADFSLRGEGVSPAETSSVERADLHALLFRGRLRVEVRGRRLELGEGHPFLVAERLLTISERALDAWEHGQALFIRSDVGGIVLGVRVSTNGDALLTLGAAGARDDRAPHTFPAIGVPDLVEASLSFGRALSRALLRRDRAQCMNLRLSAFRRQVRETSDALREVCREDSKINPRPEPYRAFAESSNAGRTESLRAPTRLRYSQRWRALVPGIDLRATFLCGDRLIVGAAAETFCLDRATGEVNWRTETERATCVVTPGGIARLSPDGRLEVLDFGNGEVTLRTHIAPRLGAPPVGAVVNVPGLPRLLIVTEGERHLVALDLASGEARWRFAWGRGGALRMKRHGKLLYVASGDSGLTALDVQTGSVVFRLRNRLRFRSSPSLDHDALFALAGGVNSASELVCIDPYSGETRWKRALEAPSTVEGAPLVTGRVVASAVRDRHGLKLTAFCRETGEPLWTTEGSAASIGTSWLAVDDLFIGNSPTGELFAIEADGGKVRYRHVLGRALETDIPRRLEPVLRSGALFVPHTDVHVFRPHDGALLATISPCDAIPDLLRVDERCDVYVAEDSGHLVSFGVGPRLSLVR